MIKIEKGFTLAEVLITLAIIGVVAALTIPSVVRNYQDTQFKTAYKKVYSDMNRAFSEAIAFSEFPERKNNCYDVDFANFVRNTMKENFKVIKDCPQGHAFECWVQGDTVDSGKQPKGEASAFIDASGRAWAEFQVSRSIILVDTNGSKAPNRFGKDRWHFAFFNKGVVGDCTITPSLPVQIRPYQFGDYLTEATWCNHPPCYYKEWLMK